MTDDSLALCISFNDESYAQGEEARTAIVAKIRAMPEVADVWHVANGFDSDTCKITVTSPSVLEKAKSKIEELRGVEKVYRFD